MSVPETIVFHGIKQTISSSTHTTTHPPNPGSWNLSLSLTDFVFRDLVEYIRSVGGDIE